MRIRLEKTVTVNDRALTHVAEVESEGMTPASLHEFALETLYKMGPFDDNQIVGDPSDSAPEPSL